MHSSHQRENTLAGLAETGPHQRKWKIGENWFPSRSNAPLCTLVFIQPPSHSEHGCCVGECHRDAASGVASCSQMSPVHLHSWLWAVLTPPDQRPSVGRCVLLGKPVQVFEVKVPGNTQSTPKPSSRGHCCCNESWGVGGPAFPLHSVFLASLCMSSIPLPDSHEWPSRKHRSILENLGSAANSSCPQEQPGEHISCKCLSNNLSQQLLFAGAFYLASGFETLGCSWVPFSHYSLQPGALDTLLLILPKWNLSFSHYHIILESRALTKILNVMRCYEITRASTTVFWTGSPRCINLINRWV